VCLPARESVYGTTLLKCLTNLCNGSQRPFNVNGILFFQDVGRAKDAKVVVCHDALPR
jgi:hypothetical protein